MGGEAAWPPSVCLLPRWSVCVCVVLFLVVLSLWAAWVGGWWKGAAWE